MTPVAELVEADGHDLVGVVALADIARSAPNERGGEMLAAISS